MNLSKIERKKFRVRNKLKKVSSKDRFRLSVSRSNKNTVSFIVALTLFPVGEIVVLIK